MNSLHPHKSCSLWPTNEFTQNAVKSLDIHEHLQLWCPFLTCTPGPVYLYNILGGRPFYPSVPSSVPSSIHPSSSSRKKKMMQEEEHYRGARDWLQGWVTTTCGTRHQTFPGPRAWWQFTCFLVTIRPPLARLEKNTIEKFCARKCRQKWCRSVSSLSRLKEVLAK